MECFNPSTTDCFEDDQEVIFMKKNLTPTREQRKGRGRNIRLQDCFLQHQGITKNYLPKKLQKQMDFESSSSSSSSSDSSSSSSSSSDSSSSDSEEELKTVMKPRIPSQFLWRTKQQQQMQQMPREWFTVVDLEGFRPQDVTAKLNPKCRILVIKVKKDNIRQQQQMEQLEERGQTFGKKLVRIIPLPENIHLEQLRVKVTTRGELVVKAPFIPRSEMVQQKQYQRNFPSTWIPLRIKGIFGGSQQQPIMNKKQPRNWFTSENTNINMNINRRKQFREQQQMMDFFYPTTSFIGYPQTKDVRGREWSKTRKNMGGDLFQHSTSTPLRTEYIRDEVTGKPAMLVKVNVIGFHPEEVRVRVDESEKFLIVEATSKRCDMTVQYQQEEQRGLTVKHLLREFILPEFVDVKHIAFRVLKTGVLAIKLPIVKNMKNVSQESDEEDVKPEDMMNFKWEKPVRA